MQNKEIIDKAVDVLNVIWNTIDFDSMSNSRKKEIWSEFKSKVRASAISSSNLVEFVEKLCKKFNIQAIDKDYVKIVEIYETDTENAIIEAYRNELMIIMFKLRIFRDKKKKEYAEKQKAKELAEKYTSNEELPIEMQEDEEDEYFSF